MTDNKGVYHPYEILDRVESSSSPGKFYEIRMSKQDGKCYCLCKAWIFKARKGDGKCKHILAYISRGFEVTVMSIVDFLEIKRARPLMEPAKKLSDTVNVKRRII